MRIFLILISLAAAGVLDANLNPESAMSISIVGARHAVPLLKASQTAKVAQRKTQPTNAAALQSNSLCAKTEQIIFSCATKRAGANAARSSSKLVSLCASRDLDKENGYLQYRFGLPGKVELEFPSSRKGTQQMFRYTHYMRYQVDLTEINFEIDGYQYQIFDDYNGEEKPRISTEGVSVTAPGKAKEVSFVCRTRAKADYSKLDEVLTREQ